jgi:hypothetical protein
VIIKSGEILFIPPVKIILFEVCGGAADIFGVWTGLTVEILRRLWQ